MENATAPSGMVYTDYLFNFARRLLEAGFIKWSDEPVELKSKIKSHIYVFGRNDLTERPDLLFEVGELIARQVLHVYEGEKRKICLIGVPTAGGPLAVAACAPRCAIYPTPRIICRTMRQALKTHGAHKHWVDGRPEPEKHVYATIDNVITDGASKHESIARLGADGYPVQEIRHFVLVDRQQGGVEKLRAEKIKVHPILNLLDLAWAYAELGLWTRDRVEAVEQELAQHRFPATH